MGWQWYQLDYMQSICTSLQTDNHARTLSIGQMLFLMPNQRCQSTEGIKYCSEIEENLFTDYIWWQILSACVYVEKQTRTGN